MKTTQNSPTNEAQIQQEHLHLMTGHHRHTLLYGSIVLQLRIIFQNKERHGI